MNASAGLVLPDIATIQMVALRGGSAEPLRLAGVAFGVRTFRCGKNDYSLGPFFSDDDGVVTITRRALELSVLSELASGAMDYSPVGDCSTEIELRPWTAAEIAAAQRTRREIWTAQLPGEGELYGSLEELLRRYREAPNDRIGTVTPIRDRWDGSRSRIDYRYTVSFSTDI